MTTDIDTLKRAAELLRQNIADSGDCDHASGICFCEDKYIAAALEALAERMGQEPVAWEHTFRKIGGGRTYSQADHSEFPMHPDPDPGYEWVRASPLYSALQTTPEDVRDAVHPLDALLPELCQLLDAFKREAESNGEGWTEWDESVRVRLRQVIADYNLAAMQQEQTK